MRVIATILVLSMLLAPLGGAVADSPSALQPAQQSARFAWVDVIIDSKNESLAACQFELSAQEGGVTLVGVEGGEHPAFAEPPYYDPMANMHDRIVIAAFNTGDNLPRGSTRVARVMLRVTGEKPPVYSAKLIVAANAEAKPIDANIQISEGAAQ